MALNTERNNTILIRGFDDIVILLRYLYMNENHKVVVDNSLCRLEIGLRPDLRFSVKNLNFPLLPDSVRALELDEMLAIIDQLEEEPAQEYPDSFKNRWEEIKDITLNNLALNYFNGKHI